MKKFTSLSFFACVLLFFVSVSAFSPIDDEPVHVDKRNEVCTSYKRNVLGKRNYTKKCPCALASSIFEGPVDGLVVYSQDECGTTTVTGFIGRGLDPNVKNYTFQVTNDCGMVLQNLGSLGAKFEGGAAKPFSQKFTNFNLNCDKDGILFTKSGASSKKRNYCEKPYYKRQGGDGAYTRITGDGTTYGTARIGQL